MSDNSSALNKVLSAVEPNNSDGWIEYVMKTYYQVCKPLENYQLTELRLAAFELQTLRAKEEFQSIENKQLRARVALLEKKLTDVKSMQEEERE